MKKVSNTKRFSIIPEELLELSKEEESTLNDFIGKNENEKKVIVRITAEDVEGLIPQLEEFNFEVIASSPENHFVEGAIPARRIAGLRTLTDEGILGVLPVYEPITNGGVVDSQADFVHESDRVREAVPDGIDGEGVTVGIMSDSFDDLGGAEGDIISGDLPANGVKVLQDYNRGGSDEGRGMAQLVHDLAPGADLAFSSVFVSEADFAQQIRDLADPNKGNADVLVDDIIYFAEPFFQDGIIAQAVDDVVTNNKVSYFSSAGNSADKAFESDEISFVADSTLDANVSFPGTYYDFDPGSEIDTSQSITLNGGQRLILSFQWDDPFYTENGVDTDIDLFLLDSKGNQVTSSAYDNLGNQTPVEILGFTNPGGTTETYELVISKYSGPNPGRIKYVNFGSQPASTEYINDAGTIYGHAAATNAKAVAAVPWYDQDNPESFTSKGSTTILFEADGTPKSVPEVRQTPDIAAIDGTNTSFFGRDISQDGDSFPNFFGTSAAAPHAAAIAALIKEANPDATPEQVYGQLENTAEDIQTPGRDNLTGVGLINAYDAVFGQPIPASLDFSDDFETGSLSLMYTTNSTGAGRIQIAEDRNPDVESNHLVLDSAADGTGFDSLNEVVLHFDATNSSEIQLSFDQREFDDDDHPMSTSFIGSENSDGVALSIDGDNWYSLMSFTDTDSTNTYQNHSFDLSSFAADNGLTLDSNVWLKFQQFDNYNIDSDGIAIDNIAIAAKPTANNLPTDGDDVLVGTEDNDNINALSGRDVVDGLGGDDTLKGSRGDDTLNGGSGRDRLLGQAGNDILAGGDGRDFLVGAAGNDYLSGEDERDLIRGGAGEDTLIGGAGKDILFGNQKRDVFVLMNDLQTKDVDIILDFELGTDVLGVSDLEEVDNYSVANNSRDNASVIRGSDRQPMAILPGIVGISMNNLDFVEV